MNPKRKVVALLRVSTDAQDVKRQRADMEKLCRKFNLEIFRPLELQGVSGTSTLENADVRKILGDLSRPEISGLAISALDRLFRPKTYGHFGILDTFVEQGKVIFSAREGEVDPATDEGFSRCVSAGGQAGAEWRELRRRTRDGKEALRREGRHVNGASSLPRGVLFDKATGKWSYDENYVPQVKRMFALALEGQSYHSIAAAIGGITFQGVRHALKNPIWAFGTRTYPADQNREEAVTVTVIKQPLIPVATWEAAQVEMARRISNWRKTKRPSKFLVASLLRCGCGKPMYLRCASKIGIEAQNRYYCSTGFRGRGPKCGALSVRQQCVDGVVETLLSQHLTKPALLAQMLAQVATPVEPTPDAAKEVERLEGKRERVIEMRSDGLISREKCAARLHTIDRELSAARSNMATPATAPTIDPVMLAKTIVRYFAKFRERTFENKRDTLLRAVREIIIDGGAIPSLTLRGGFLGEIVRANLLQHSRHPYSRQSRSPAPESRIRYATAAEPTAAACVWNPASPRGRNSVRHS